MNSIRSNALLLSALTLRTIADKLDALVQLGVDVREFAVGDVTVYVTRRDDQREGSTYYVTHLESARSVPVKPVLRVATGN